MTGKIFDKREVAEGTLMVTFALDQKVDFKPGQYVIVTLPRLDFPDERGPKRQFSINNPPSQNEIITITTRLSESGFKKTLSGLPVDSEVELGPIGGQFTLPEDTGKPLVFIAGGIGITPFMSMLRNIFEKNLPYKITLVYSNRNQSSTAFLEELQNYQLQTTNYKLILTMTDDPSWTGEKRLVDANFIKEYFPNVNNQTYLVVGPPAMVAGVQKSLFEAGVLPQNIKVENFTGY